MEHHVHGGPPLNCLQLVDILYRVWVPDWTPKLQRWPSQGFVHLLLDGHGAPLPVPPQEPESLAGLVGDIGNVRIPTKVV